MYVYILLSKSNYKNCVFRFQFHREGLVLTQHIRLSSILSREKIASFFQTIAKIIAKIRRSILHERRDKGRIGAYHADCVIRRSASSGSAARAIALPIIFLLHAIVSSFSIRIVAQFLSSRPRVYFFPVSTSLAIHVPRERYLRSRGPA